MSSHSEIKKLKPSTAKNAVIRTFDQFLEQHGYKLRGTIGMGSYAKVKYENASNQFLKRYYFCIN